MNFNARELILQVDNDPQATPREKQLADALAKAIDDMARIPNMRYAKGAMYDPYLPPNATGQQ